MMKHEFEALAGYEVSFEDYKNIIEPMYMATDLSKEAFVKCIDKKRFALPTKKDAVKAMKREAKHLYEICGRRTDFEAEYRLEKMAHDYLKRFYNVDWSKDSTAYAIFMKEYEYPEIGRGCTYPKELILGVNSHELERIALV